MFNRRPLIAATFCIAVLSATACAAAGEDNYLKNVKPLLRERCFSCHGALKQEAELRLDTAAGMFKGGDSGAALARGDAAGSLLIERISADDAAERMPPEHEGERLSPEQIKQIADWISAGAPAPVDEQPEADPSDHWSFRPILRPAVPVVENSQSLKNPIDAFLAQKREEQGVAVQGPASRIVLLRRLYFDLIGVPPSAEEIEACESDRSPDWREKIVNRLLDDSRHGERWARHWMDVWRYSDWSGHDGQLRRSQKHIWHWRDWIVESLNDDAPYDEMVRRMLAADELYPGDLNRQRATGFLARNFMLFNRNQWMDETVEHVGKAFLGLTLNCAKCHDHKYDPIAQTDYYKMRAVFEPYHVRHDMAPGEADLSRDSIPRVFDGWLDKPTYRFVRGQESAPDESTAISPGPPAFLKFASFDVRPIDLPPVAWQPERQPWIVETYLAAADRKTVAAEAAVVEAKEKLSETSGGNESSKEPSVELDQAKLKIAEAALDVAKAERESIARRGEAMRDAWNEAKTADDKRGKKKGSNENNGAQTVATVAETGAVGDKRTRAIHAERLLVVAHSQHALSVAELAVLQAAEKEKPKAVKKLSAAQTALEKAVAQSEAEVKPTDRFTPLVGAVWSATRFGESRTDDPQLAFTPQSTGRRTALANWIVDPCNPLTARVAVNHIWLRHMGAPLAATTFDLGRNGARPSHPELLDWLAAEFIESGWSMKRIHRLIVASAAYQMSSSLSGGEASAAKDPDNRCFWRRPAMRLESQAIRDSIFAHAGELDSTLGGPPVLAKNQATSRRRSLYFFHANDDRNLLLSTFDEAPVNECYRREQSIVPQQALALMNGATAHDAAAKIARRFSNGDDDGDDPTFIRKAFLVLLCVKASDQEIAACQESLKAWRSAPDGSARQARAYLIWALVNHNDFVVVR